MLYLEMSFVASYARQIMVCLCDLCLTVWFAWAVALFIIGCVVIAYGGHGNLSYVVYRATCGFTSPLWVEKGNTMRNATNVSRLFASGDNAGKYEKWHFHATAGTRSISMGCFWGCRLKTPKPCLRVLLLRLQTWPTEAALGCLPTPASKNNPQRRGLGVRAPALNPIPDFEIETYGHTPINIYFMCVNAHTYIHTYT